MIKKINHRLQHLPIAFSGIALGVGGIGNCLSYIFSKNNYDASWISYITISFVILLVAIMIFKHIRHCDILKWELNEPLLVSLQPTLCMSLMLISGFIASFSNQKTSAAQIIGTITMLIAIFCQFIIVFFFFKNLIKKFSWHDHPVYGSWFVPTVGIITSCTVANKFVLLPNEFFQIIWFIGFISYLITFFLFTYSILFKTKIKEHQLPTMAIYFAPASLSTAGFLHVFCLSSFQTWREFAWTYPEQFKIAFLLVLVPFSLVFSIFLYFFVFKSFITLKFQPIFACLTFPLAIGSTAMVLTSDYIQNITSAHDLFIDSLTYGFGIIGIIFSFASTIIIFYILFRMIIIGIRTLCTDIKDNEFHEVKIKK